MHFTLADAVHRKNNNFDLVRLIAAITVIFGHSFYLFAANGYAEPVKKILVNDYSGSLAVYTFFFLSGIFITSSFVNSQSVLGFLSMRVLRIWPALIICVLITVFIAGPVFTSQTLHNYFHDPQTRRYLFNDMLMWRFEPKLSTLFDKNLYPTATNGALWTLPAEIRCYLLVLVLGICSLLKRWWAVLLAIAIFFHFRNNYRVVTFFGQPELVKFTLFFLAGMLAYTFRHYIIINYKISLAFILISVAAYFINFNLFTGLFYIAFIYAILVFATSKLIKKIKLPGDYSYGIYIYGFLVQQIITHFFPKLTTYPGMLITIPLTATLGIISWHIIEHPAINAGKKLKRRFSTRNHPDTINT